MTETFKPIPILPGFHVSDLGRIRKNANTFPALHITNRGILTLHTRIEGQAKCHTVSRLVYAAFVGDCAGQVVGYRDGDKTNCKAENLYLLKKGNDMAKARATRWGKK